MPISSERVLLHRLLLLLLLWDGMVAIPDLLLAGDWLALAAADDRGMLRVQVDTSQAAHVLSFGR